VEPISVENVDRDLRALCVDIGPPVCRHVSGRGARPPIFWPRVAAAGAAVTIGNFPRAGAARHRREPGDRAGR